MQGGDDSHKARATARIEAEADKQLARFRTTVRGLVPRLCPNCGYKGRFTAFGQPPRFDARCGGCASLERHRLVVLWIQRTDPFAVHQSVLHFAPEPQLTPHIKGAVARYETADLSDRRPVTHKINIEATGLPEASYHWIICSHVLEHVDDAKAFAEMRRLLKPGGKVLIMTPIVEGWAKTYENPAITAAPDRLVHFGQNDHLRMYGRDLRDRICAAGYDLTEYTAVEPDVLTYGLMRGETIFIATKPA